MTGRGDRLRLVPLGDEAPGGNEDARLLARIAAGGIAALGDLYEKYARSLHPFVRHLVGADDADDVVQAVFERVLRAASAYDPAAASARPWLYGIAVRLVRERRRASTRFARAMARVFEAHRERGGPPLDERHDLSTGLMRLSDTKRAVLLLSEVEGFTCEEIAEVCSVPVGTVWTRLHHARKELRMHLSRKS